MRHLFLLINLLLFTTSSLANDEAIENAYKRYASYNGEVRANCAYSRLDSLHDTIIEHLSGAPRDRYSESISNPVAYLAKSVRNYEMRHPNGPLDLGRYGCTSVDIEQVGEIVDDRNQTETDLEEFLDKLYDSLDMDQRQLVKLLLAGRAKQQAEIAMGTYSGWASREMKKIREHALYLADEIGSPY